MNKYLKILLVDDDDTTNFISKRIFKKMGLVNVEIVEGGGQAIEYLKLHCPDLMFLDLNLPRIDGWEVLQIIQSENICLNLKIVVLTSSIRSYDQDKVKKYKSVVEYIEKPITREIVESIINNLHNKK